MSTVVDLMQALEDSLQAFRAAKRPPVFRIVWCDRCSDLDNPCRCGGEYEVQVRDDLTVDPSVCPCCGEEQA